MIFKRFVTPIWIFVVGTFDMWSVEWIHSCTEAIGYAKWTFKQKWQDSVLNERNGRHGDKDTIHLSKTRNCLGQVSLCKSKKPHIQQFYSFSD